MPETSKFHSTDILSLLLTSIALLAVVWIIVPAPSVYVWLLSVAASEWSLWFGASALVGIVVGLLNRMRGGKSKLRLASLLIGSLAFVVSLYPFFTVVSLAREQNVSLSLKRYFGGFFSKIEFSSEDKTQNLTTYTFARIDSQDLQLDVYVPTNKTENNGASVVVVHGGSWNGGARSDFPQWNRLLASEGFTVFDIDYRLAPPNFLTATGDVKCAVHWVKENSAKFNVSPERIALLGRSAGAHLALLAAYSAGDARLPASCSENQTTETVRAVVAFYAPVDLVWAYDHPANPLVIDGPATLSRFLGGGLRESAEMPERYVLASPVSHVASNTPTTLLIHGGQDQLVRPENMNFLTAKLEEANVPHKTLFIPYAQHGFDYNFNGWAAQISEPAILHFLGENTR